MSSWCEYMFCNFSYISFISISRLRLQSNCLSSWIHQHRPTRSSESHRLVICDLKFRWLWSDQWKIKSCHSIQLLCLLRRDQSFPAIYSDERSCLLRRRFPHQSDYIGSSVAKCWCIIPWLIDSCDWGFGWKLVFWKANTPHIRRSRDLCYSFPLPVRDSVI